MVTLLLNQNAMAQPAMEILTNPDAPQTVTKEECEANITAAVVATEMLIVLQCQQVLEAADAYIKKQQEEVGALQELVSQQDALLSTQQRRLTDFESRQEKWYNNPIYIGVLGLMAGGLTVMMLEN